jgi:outer membrane protein OmpA-like peptidoglycan-associated protein
MDHAHEQHEQANEEQEREGGALLGIAATAALTVAIVWALLWPTWHRPPAPTPGLKAVAAILPGAPQAEGAHGAAAQHGAAPHGADPHAAADPHGAAPHEPATTGAEPAGAPLGELVAHALPNGAQVRVPERGVEGRLLAFVADGARPVDTTTWFDFDRLTFETGAAVLRPQSQDQLRAVADILRAYPRVRLKIGGYTDNVGQPEANQRLSEHRAANVRDALAGLGVEAGRLEAEGYGERHPVGDNATAEGRARNRRISMRVLEK